MYLKSIEVHGFKSFANKITFDFHNGITSIVGPNGSGKSNVGDAVRWVLGEQSAKQLRGSKMEDVIFSGTETRKPMGYAYVAITLNNSDHKLAIDFDDVTVARRVYRSGESEYLINGHTCRLKDIQELFLDTGIGKEGYSIIGQGQIDKILSGKPEDRRELFDEAAGIVKFKKRKLSAEKNLEEEKQNLYRVNDILSEIEKQIGPLEQQSIKAKEFLRLRDELRILEVNLFLLDNDRIEESKKELEHKYKIAVDSLDNAIVEYENSKKEYESLESEVIECTASLEEYKKFLSECHVRKEKLEGNIKVLQVEIQRIIDETIQYDTRMEILEQEIIAKKNELDQFIQEKKGIDIQMDEIDELQSQMIGKLEEIQNNISNYNHWIETCNNEIYDFMNDNSSIKSNLQRYETILEHNNIKKVELNQKLLHCKSEEAMMDLSVQENEAKLKSIANLMYQILGSNKEFEYNLTENENMSSELEKKLSDTQREYHIEHSKLESLKNMTERYEGYGTSIRKIMELKESKDGLLGVVADLLKVAPNYEIAIETALGGNIQNIVTDNEFTAKKMVEYLKQNKFGRATFLPLTSVRGKESQNQDKILSEVGVIGYANTLITTEDRFLELFQSLLGRCLVVDHIDHGLLLAKRYNYSLRIVTLEGELLNPGGSISGGAYKNSSNLLSRRREIENFEQVIIKLQNEIEKIRSDREHLKNYRMSIEKQFNDSKIKLQELYIEQNTVQLSYDQEIKNKKNSQQIFYDLTKETQEIDLQSKELKLNIETLTESLQQNVNKSSENNVKIEEYSVLLRRSQVDEKNQTEAISSVRIQFSVLEQKNQNSLENIKRIKRELEKSHEDISNIEIAKRSSFSHQDIKLIQIKELENEKLICQKNTIESESQLSEFTVKREQIVLKQKSIFEKRDYLAKEKNDLDKECFRLTNLIDKLVEQLDAKMNYIWEEYELTYSTALEYKEDSFLELSQANKLIVEMKSKIKNLGDININAIEDFKSISERFEFLRIQRDDLIKAEETLLGIIEELDLEMRKQFEEKFSAIRNQFDLVFKEFFGGGKATLELTTEEDILEAGIIITSQPPGKKLQNMMQLSGGEKALTAISLLFAIQNLKPSPFCLLDEIEAALDDANVKRYAKYLHKLTKDTQFIIITHRRGTMAAADRLYGITMQEKGVSTLVSVNLIEDALDS